MLWGPTPSASAPWATASSAGEPAVHNDIIVASTNQKSWDGATPTTRFGTGDTNYCDKIRYDATANTESYTFVTSGGSPTPTESPFGLMGKTKCTYIFSIDKTKGAPAFKIIKADFMAFQLHFLEYAEIDHKDYGLRKITPVSAAPGHYGAYDTAGAQFYPSPIAIRTATPAQSVYPPGASSTENIAWNQANLNYFSSTPTDPGYLAKLTPGSIGPVKYYWSTQDTNTGSPPLKDGVNHSPFYAKVATDTYTYLEQDSGILVQDWARWNNVHDDYNVNKTAY